MATSLTACHSIAVDSGGTPYIWGRNDFGQLGQVDGVPIGGNALFPREVTGWNKHEGSSVIVAAAVGKVHLMLVDEEWCLFGCEKNHVGQLGVGNTMDATSGWKKASQPVEIEQDEDEGKKKKGSNDKETSVAKEVKFVQVSCGESFTALLTSLPTADRKSVV